MGRSQKGLRPIFAFGEIVTMAALNCDWRTVQDWADLAAQDPSLYLAFLYQGGTTYFRVCADGTVWMNKDLFDAISDA